MIRSSVVIGVFLFLMLRAVSSVAQAPIYPAQLDSIIISEVRSGVDSAAMAVGLSPGYSVKGDASLQDVLTTFSRADGETSDLVILREVRANAIPNEANVYLLEVRVKGDVLKQNSLHSEPFYVFRSNRVQLEFGTGIVGSSRYVTLADEGSFWTSVLQPTLVILGAGLIVALFFFIRS